MALLGEWLSSGRRNTAGKPQSWDPSNALFGTKSRAEIEQLSREVPPSASPMIVFLPYIGQSAPPALAL
jgi:hypothetical protein